MKYHIITYGCSLNQSDSEFMKGQLKAKGHQESSEEEADLIVVNSCSVKQQAETKLFRSLNKHKNKKVIVAGCVPQAEKSYQHSKLKQVSILGTNQLTKVAEVAEKTVEGERVVLLAKEKEQRLLQPKIRKNPLIEILPINEGCLGVCTYCKTKQARGSLLSYPVRQIKHQLRQAVKEGCKEIWITSQDTGCYGLDIGSSFPELLETLLEEEGDFKIRIGMCNPDWGYMYKEELKKLFHHPKLYKFLHIPVQAGNDAVLKEMKRNYNAEDYLIVCKELRQEHPDLTIATDIIVGFPTETDAAFQETINVVKQSQPDIIYVSRFWARPRTKAASMKQLSTNTIKERGSTITKVAHETSAKRNLFWQAWKGVALVDEKNKVNSVARNYAYKPILLPLKEKVGSEVEVEIKSTTKFDLRI